MPLDSKDIIFDDTPAAQESKRQAQKVEAERDELFDYARKKRDELTAKGYAFRPLVMRIAPELEWYVLEQLKPGGELRPFLELGCFYEVDIYLGPYDIHILGIIRAQKQ